MCLLLLESLLFLTSLLFLVSPPCCRSCCFWFHIVLDIHAVSGGLLLLTCLLCWRPAAASIPAAASFPAVQVVLMYAKVSDDWTFVLLQLDWYFFRIIVLSEYQNRPALEKISDYRIKVSIYWTIAYLTFNKLSVAHLCTKPIEKISDYRIKVNLSDYRIFQKTLSCPSLPERQYTVQYLLYSTYVYFLRLCMIYPVWFWILLSCLFIFSCSTQSHDIDTVIFWFQESAHHSNEP